jgi:tetraacyldisaccharide 4'-kinase
MNSALFLMNRVASFGWSSVNALARGLAHRSQRARLPGRVISVGNIQAGGAGKTPVVGWLARQAHDRGLTVCILTRGYGGAWEKNLEGGVLAPGETAAISECGDEAALLRDLAPHAWIGVGRDRVAQFGRVRRRHSHLGLIILDDGFQNFRIHKDVELVALTSSRPGEKVFRDFQGALKAADLLVWTKGDEAPRAKTAPLVRLYFRLRAPVNVRTDALFVSGLADGEEAVNSARRAGYRIKRHLNFSDHEFYTREQVELILAQAKAEGLAILTTGKDWVKWREFGVSEEAVGVLEPEIELSDADRAVLERIVWGS